MFARARSRPRRNTHESAGQATLVALVGCMTVRDRRRPERSQARAAGLLGAPLWGAWPLGRRAGSASSWPRAARLQSAYEGPHLGFASLSSELASFWALMSRSISSRSHRALADACWSVGSRSGVGAARICSSRARCWAAWSVRLIRGEVEAAAFRASFDLGHLGLDHFDGSVAERSSSRAVLAGGLAWLLDRSGPG